MDLKSGSITLSLDGVIGYNSGRSLIEYVFGIARMHY